VKVGINGIGLWGPGLNSWEEFQAAREECVEIRPADFVAPSPGVIPAREQRRAPLPVKLAVEVAQQACEMAAVDHSTVASVFTSAMGDSGITDYLCRTLAGPDKMVSPTKFHNSVHNAASGYWSIAAKNRATSGYVGGFEHSFPVALLEATVLCITEETPVLLVANDVAHGAPFDDIVRIEASFACALLIDGTPRSDGWLLTVENRAGYVAWPAPEYPGIAELGELNPSARSLSLLDACAGDVPIELRMPLNEHAHLQLAVSAS